MRNLLLTLATGIAVASTATPIINTVTTVQNQNKHESTVKNELNLINSSLNNYNNSLNNLRNGGKNAITYYFAYYNVFLDHDTTKLINDNIQKGVGAITGILSSIFSVGAPVIAAIGALLVAQWNVWNINDKDEGDGVQIQLLGPSSLIIIGVWSQ